MEFTLRNAILLGLIGMSFAGCKRIESASAKSGTNEPVQSLPQASGSDLLKTQREALEKAKALESQMNQQAKEQEKALEGAQK